MFADKLSSQPYTTSAPTLNRWLLARAALVLILGRAHGAAVAVKLGPAFLGDWARGRACLTTCIRLRDSVGSLASWAILDEREAEDRSGVMVSLWLPQHDAGSVGLRLKRWTRR